jgi:hypothetical protein
MMAVPKGPLTLKTLSSALIQDILIAIVLMFLVQLISNGLYAVQIGRPEKFLEYMLDPYTAFRLYGPVDPHLVGFKFPGQLAITCTTYIPSLLFYIICISIILLKPFYSMLFFIFDILNIDVTGKGKSKCSPPAYIATLAGVFGVALASLRFFIDSLR